MKRSDYVFVCLLIVALSVRSWAQTAPVSPSTAPTPAAVVQPVIPDIGPAIQAAWNAGRNFYPGPGVFVVRETLKKYSGCSLIGLGPSETTIISTVSPMMISGFQGQPVAGGEISGFTFDESNYPGTKLDQGGSPESGLVIRNMKFIDADSGQYNAPGVNWSGIQFINSTLMGDSDNATYSGLWWFGAPAAAGANECLLGGNNVTFEHGGFVRTQRGIVVRWPMQKPTFTDLDFEQIVEGQPNANEIILVEGGSLVDGTLSTIQAHGCRGRFAFDANMIGCTLSGFDVDGGEGITLGWTNSTAAANALGNGSTVTGNHFTQMELRHVVHVSMNLATGNRFDNIGIVSPLGGSWVNQDTFNPIYYAAHAFFTQNSPGANAVDYPNTVKVVGLPSNVTVGLNGQ